MTNMVRARHIAAILIVAGSLSACGGGSDSAEESTDEDTVITVADIPGIAAACENTLNMIGVTGQVLAGEVDPDAAAAVIDEFVASVPDDIRADATVMANAYTAYVEILAEYAGDMTAAISDPAVVTALDALDSPETTASIDRVNQFLVDECELTE